MTISRGTVVTLVGMAAVAVIAGMLAGAWHTARKVALSGKGPEAQAWWVALPVSVVLVGGVIATVAVAIAAGREKAPQAERAQLVPRVWQP